jgi:hypothetical protein
LNQVRYHVRKGTTTKIKARMMNESGVRRRCGTGAETADVDEPFELLSVIENAAMIHHRGHRG